MKVELSIREITIIKAALAIRVIVHAKEKRIIEKLIVKLDDQINMGMRSEE